MSYLITFLVGLLGFGSGAAFAQNAAPAEASKEALEEVVVTALPFRGSVLETAQPVSVLAGEALLRSRQGSLGETLAQLPGVTASAFGPLASRPILRGQGGLRVQTYQDSADTLDVGALSDDHAVTLEPLLARSIEVLRGPAALMFGNSAAAGAVNVVTTRLPTDTLPKSLMGSLEMRGNSPRDDARAAARLAWQIDDAWQLSADGFRSSSEDLSIPGAEGRDRLPNSDGSSEGANLSLAWAGARGAWALSANRHEMDYGLPGSEDEDIRLDLQQRRFDFAGELRMDAGPFSRLQLRGSRNDYGHVELEERQIGTRYDQLGEEWRMTLEHGQPGSARRGVLGAQLRQLDFTAEGEEAFLPASTTRNLGGFFFEEFSRGRWVLEFGGRLERQRIAPDAALEDALREYDDTAFSASIALRWQHSAASLWTLQFNSTQRHPTATELYAQGPHVAVRRYEIGDATLGKENGRAVDLGYKWSGQAWRVQASAFANDYDAYIVASPTIEREDNLPVVRFEAREASFRGGEILLANDRLLRVGSGDLALELFGDYVRARDENGEPLPQVPPLRLGGNVAWDDGIWRVAIESVWHDRQARIAANESASAGYTLLGLDVGLRQRLGAATAVWFVRGSNLLDEEARRHVSPLKDFAPLRGRSVTAGVRIDF